MKRTLVGVGFTIFAVLAYWGVEPLWLYMNHRPPAHLEAVPDRSMQLEIGTAWDAWGSPAAEALRRFGLPPQSSDATAFKTSQSDWWEPPVSRAGTTFKTYSNKEEVISYFSESAKRLGWMMENSGEARYFDEKKQCSYSLDIQSECQENICNVKLIVSTNEP